MASGSTLDFLTVKRFYLPAATIPQFDTRNNIPAINLDAAADEYAIAGSLIPSIYAGGGLTIDVFWMSASATSGDIVLGISIERDNDNNHDLDSDAFATEQTGTSTANGTSGKLIKKTITVSSGANMDSAAAGEPIRIKVRRKGSDGSDTMTGDAQLVYVHIKET